MPTAQFISATVARASDLKRTVGRIVIVNDAPRFEDMDDDARAFYDQQASEIVEVLFQTLPYETLIRVAPQLLAKIEKEEEKECDAD
jgi:hypothetical protein